MKHIFVRPARPEDLKTLVEWSGGNPAFDPEIFRYATTYTLAAFDSSGVIAYAPVQQPLMIDAIGFHPAANDCQKAAAMKEITHTVITQGVSIEPRRDLFPGIGPGHELIRRESRIQAHGLAGLPCEARGSRTGWRQWACGLRIAGRRSPGRSGWMWFAKPESC